MLIAVQHRHCAPNIFALNHRDILRCFGSSWLAPEGRHPGPKHSGTEPRRAVDRAGACLFPLPPWWRRFPTCTAAPGGCRSVAQALASRPEANSNGCPSPLEAHPPSRPPRTKPRCPWPWGGGRVEGGGCPSPLEAHSPARATSHQGLREKRIVGRFPRQPVRSAWTCRALL